MTILQIEKESDLGEPLDMVQINLTACPQCGAHYSLSKYFRPAPEYVDPDEAERYENAPSNQGIACDHCGWNTLD
jgi:hypothetical protein